MSSPFPALFLASIFSLSPALFPSTGSPVHDQGQPGRTRDVYVSVTNSSGAPVTDVTPADFVVREDGVAREVLKVAPATAPMQIALLVDDSTVSAPSIQRLREGIQAFVAALKGKAEIALIEIGERPAVLVASTTSAQALERGIGRIFSRTDAGAYLLEGVSEASQGLRKREAARPVILALTFESATEFSTDTYERVIADLEKTGVELNILSIGSPVISNTDEMRNRNLLIAEGTQRTGGRREQVLSDLGIAEKMKQIALSLSSELVLTYAHPDTLIPPEKLSISAARPGLTVRARTRVPGR
jgi:VWFA-related protein